MHPLIVITMFFGRDTLRDGIEGSYGELIKGRPQPEETVCHPQYSALNKVYREI